MTVHTFGAYFGLVVSRFLYQPHKDKRKREEQQDMGHQTDVFAVVGMNPTTSELQSWWWKGHHQYEDSEAVTRTFLQTIKERCPHVPRDLSWHCTTLS